MLAALTLLAGLMVGQAAGPPAVSLPPAAASASPAAELAGLLSATAAAQPAEPPEVPAALPEKQAAIPAAAEAAVSAAPTATAGPDRWSLMKTLQGSWPGSVMDSNRIAFSGWNTMSFTGSTDHVSNVPVVWNDRANKFLFQQNWFRLERFIVPTGTTNPTFGFRIDVNAGSDYRYTLPRGLLNGQLNNSDPLGNLGRQNLYGVDPIQHYVEGYFPTVFQGLDIKAGRFFTPFGNESNEAISSPLMSKSYAFNWSPPFTHYGILATATLNPVWTVQAALINGNDVMLGDPSEEARFLGTVKYTRPGGRDVAVFGTSIGRGRFNSGDPFNPSTFGLQSEPAGRNNINVFDVVYTHIFNPVLNYTVEGIYGYQYGVPANVPGGIIREDATSGTAHWMSVAQYLTYSFTPRLNGIARFELFDDFNGQRTGFVGLYEALTLGVQWRPRKDIIFRPEIRYDNNGYSRPFEGHHDILTFGADLTFRW